MSFDLVIAGVGGQPIDRMVELIAAACAEAGVAFASTAPRGPVQLGGTRLAQVSVGECSSPVVTEDTGGLLVGLEVGEALRHAKFCARDGVALVDTLAVVPAAPRDPRPYPEPAAVASALREAIQSVHMLDFRAASQKASGSPDFAYAVMLGAATAVPGLSPLADAWGTALEALKGEPGEAKAFAAGRALSKELK